MRLSEESISFDYSRALAPDHESWDVRAELQERFLLRPDRLDAFREELDRVRSQVATERELRDPPAKLRPLEAGFINLPQNLLRDHRKQAEHSLLGRVLSHAARLREEVGRVVVLGTGGAALAGKALFQALRHSHHNEMPEQTRLGHPRIYFDGDGLDSDTMQELLQLLENECVDPELPAERWGLVVISKDGEAIESAAAYRAFRAEAVRYYGSASERWREYVVPVTGERGNFRELCAAEGFEDRDVLTIADDIGGRYAAFTPAGLLPAALVGLDLRALLLGADQMTKRFLDEPFERNPVLQFAAVNHLAYKELGKPIRATAVWTKKLAGIGEWYDELLSESLGKRGYGPTPISVVQPRGLHSRGQQFQEGARDKMINNIVVRSPNDPAMPIGMADCDQDDLNVYSRKTYPDILDATLRGSNESYHDAARPTADISVPMLTEHTVGQLMQMLMLATVVEARLAGVNPYGEPGVLAYRRRMHGILCGGSIEEVTPTPSDH